MRVLVPRVHTNQTTGTTGTPSAMACTCLVRLAALVTVACMIENTSSSLSLSAYITGAQLNLTLRQRHKGTGTATQGPPRAHVCVRACVRARLCVCVWGGDTHTHTHTHCARLRGKNSLGLAPAATGWNPLKKRQPQCVVSFAVCRAPCAV